MARGQIILYGIGYIYVPSVLYKSKYRAALSSSTSYLTMKQTKLTFLLLYSEYDDGGLSM